MSSHKNRLTRLEQANPAPRRIVVRYAEQTTPAELEQLSKDESIILLVVQYAERKAYEQTSNQAG